LELQVILATYGIRSKGKKIQKQFANAHLGIGNQLLKPKQQFFKSRRSIKEEAACSFC
jgi:hypothetical protein